MSDKTPPLPIAFRRLSTCVTYKCTLLAVAVLLALTGLARQTHAQDVVDGRSDWTEDRQVGSEQRGARTRTSGEAPGDRHEAQIGEIASLDCSGNNLDRPEQGAAGTTCIRPAPAFYGDGISTLAGGPEPRYVSNRIFDDQAENLFSENGVTQWAYNWGQFIDHTIGLRKSGQERLSIGFDANDPLEYFTNSNNVPLIPPCRSSHVRCRVENKGLIPQWVASTESRWQHDPKS